MRRFRYAWLPLALVLLVTATALRDQASFARLWPDSASGAEETALRFIALMREGMMEDLLDIVVHGSLGIDPSPPGTLVRDLPLAEAEAQGLLRHHTSDALPDKAWVIGVLSRQRAFVLEQFGPDAWDKAEFWLEPVPGPAELQFVDAEGRIVGPEMARAMLDDFWSQIEQKEGVDLSVLHRPPTDRPEDQAFEEPFFAAMRVLTEYESQAPVRLVPVPETYDYLAHLSFGGAAMGKDGFHDFYLCLVRVGGAWKVESFQWSPPAYEGPDL